MRRSITSRNSHRAMPVSSSPAHARWKSLLARSTKTSATAASRRRPICLIAVDIGSSQILANLVCSNSNGRKIRSN